MQFWISSYAKLGINCGYAILDVGVCKADLYNNSIPALVFGLSFSKGTTQRQMNQEASQAAF